ncbi:uncharacterized protein [Lolium perenne]|jgi:hypothetical protein|uniref:uncharacterized protein n=1 Tax=Lolium perenne TaxID=4522 RepID=UPI0021EA10B7
MAKKLIPFLLTLALVAASASTERADAWDDDLPQRQDAMAEAVKVFSGYNPASTDPEALKRAVATVNGAMAPLRPIFKAISKMPVSTAAEVRAKEEARAAANELLTRHLGQLLPGGSVKISNEL